MKVSAQYIQTSYLSITRMQMVVPQATKASKGNRTIQNSQTHNKIKMTRAKYSFIKEVFSLQVEF